MLQDIGDKIYCSDYLPDAIPNENDRLIVFAGERMDRMYLTDDNDIPRVSDAKLSREQAGKLIYLFSVSGERFWLLMEEFSHDFTEKPGLSQKHLHSEVEFLIPDWRYFACTTALHLSYWYEHSRFCGKCGKKLVHSENERSMRCPECGSLKYPDMSVAVIVGIRDGDRIVLTRYAGSRSGYYALVAGFMEIGETLEDTVHREVMEETGLKVKNLHYVGCQPWGYSRNVLVGFYCDLDGSDSITRQESELAEAGWFTRDKIPLRENLMSLTATMMQTFKQGMDDEAIKNSIYISRPDHQI